MPRPDGLGFVKDESGAVAVTYALALTALVLIAGVGFDFGRLAAMDSELQNGADQAALAGATQLDGRPGACARAAKAAALLVSNPALTASDNQSVSVQLETACDGSGMIRFYQNKERKPASTDAEARFIEVQVDARKVDYALTALTGVLHGPGTATAMAGLGSSICKVPPIMICSPDPGNPFNAEGKKGWGLRATGHGNDRSGTGGTVSSWGPGDFGFLEVGAGQTSQLVQSLAFKQVALDCAPIDGAYPETGNPQSLYDAINTRFDIYDFSSGNGAALAPCFSGNCPAASNVVKDLVKRNDSTNTCKLGNNGWQLPPEDARFHPLPTPNPDGSYHDPSRSLDAMGLPRDLCHYNSYGSPCTGGANGAFGNNHWARVDYFKKNHPDGARPDDFMNITRYDTYKWEIDNNIVPNNLQAGSNNKQFGKPVCSTGTSDGIDRRVLTVAVVKNCSSLNGGSTRVQVDEWVDVFLVEPVVDGRGNGSIKDSIYVEIIGPSRVAGSGISAAQKIRRDVPYLVR